MSIMSKHNDQNYQEYEHPKITNNYSRLQQSIPINSLNNVLNKSIRKNPLAVQYHPGQERVSVNSNTQSNLSNKFQNLPAEQWDSRGFGQNYQNNQSNNNQLYKNFSNPNGQMPNHQQSLKYDVQAGEENYTKWLFQKKPNSYNQLAGQNLGFNPRLSTTYFDATPGKKRGYMG